MNIFFQKLKRNPLTALRLLLSKTFILPVKYYKKSSYDAKKYWSDRFKKHGPESLRAVGDEGLTEEENQKAREDALIVFEKTCNEEQLNLPIARICEIGCGNGFYTKHFLKSGANNYCGIDITDTFFSNLKSQYPNYLFINKDISTDKLEGTFDIIVMIDVIQHIVDQKQVLWAMNNIKRCLPVSGVLLLAPIRAKSRRKLWHVHTWSFSDIELWFDQNYSKKRILFRDNEYLYVIRRI